MKKYLITGSGIPVLTNDIGIEGIDAMAGRDYLHCTTADDYIQAVVNLNVIY